MKSYQHKETIFDFYSDIIWVMNITQVDRCAIIGRFINIKLKTK